MASVQCNQLEHHLDGKDSTNYDVGIIKDLVPIFGHGKHLALVALHVQEHAFGAFGAILKGFLEVVRLESRLVVMIQRHQQHAENDEGHHQRREAAMVQNTLTKWAQSGDNSGSFVGQLFWDVIDHL